jgi:hypothetical protein
MYLRGSRFVEACSRAARASATSPFTISNDLIFPPALGPSTSLSRRKRSCSWSDNFSLHDR